MTSCKKNRNKCESRFSQTINSMKSDLELEVNNATTEYKNDLEEYVKNIDKEMEE